MELARASSGLDRSLGVAEEVCWRRQMVIPHATPSTQVLTAVPNNHVPRKVRREGLALFEEIPGSQGAVRPVAHGRGHPVAGNADRVGHVRDGGAGNVNVPRVVVAQPNGRKVPTLRANAGSSSGLARIAVDASEVIFADVDVDRLCVAVTVITVDVTLRALVSNLSS